MMSATGIYSFQSTAAMCDILNFIVKDFVTFSANWSKHLILRNFSTTT